MANGTRSKKRNIESITSNISNKEQNQAWLEGYCFSPQGKALRHDIEDRRASLKLTTLLVSEESWKLKAKEAKETKRPSLNPEPQELESPKPPSNIQCLAIGLIFFDVGKSENVRYGKRKGRKQAQDLLLSEPTEFLLPVEDNMYRVVMEIANEENTNGGADPKLYVLVPEQDGLCQPYLLEKREQDEVFYFSEFVTSGKNATERKGVWNENCKIAAGYMAPKIMLKNSGDPTRFIVRPEINNINQMAMLAARYESTGEGWTTDEMLAVLERLDPDLKEKETRSFLTLWEFFDIGNDWVDGQEVIIIEQMKEYWPDVILEPDWFALIKRGMVRSEVAVKYRLQRTFLAMASREFPKITEPEALSDEDLGQLTDRLNKDAAFFVGDIEPGAPIVGEELKLLSAIRDKLKVILEAGRLTSENLANLNGSQVFEEGAVIHPATVFKEYQNANDIDTAKAALGEIARIPFQAVGVQLVEVFQKPMKGLISFIDRYLSSPATGKKDK